MSEFFQSTSGVIFEMDVPAEGTMQRERHEEKVAAGELTPVPSDAVEKQTDPDGTYRWVHRTSPKAAPRASERPAPKPADDAPDGE